MKAMVAYKGRMYFAEQDKRGRAEEADVVVYKGADELLRCSLPKVQTVDELRRIVVRMMLRRDRNEEHN